MVRCPISAPLVADYIFSSKTWNVGLYSATGSVFSLLGEQTYFRSDDTQLSPSAWDQTGRTHPSASQQISQNSHILPSNTNTHVATTIQIHTPYTHTLVTFLYQMNKKYKKSRKNYHKSFGL